MIKMDLAHLDAKDPYIVKIKNALMKATGQNIATVTILPIKRLAGASVRGAQMALSGGQSIIFYIRQEGDVYRVQINGRDYPMAGDLSPDSAESFAASMKEIAGVIVNGQKAFQKRQAMVKVAAPRKVSTTQSTVQNLQDVLDQEASIDKMIEDKTAQRDALKSQLELNSVLDA